MNKTTFFSAAVCLLTLLAAASGAIPGHFVNVRDFGAVGNGIADDTAAIQAAVNSVRSKGGSILMKGDFLSGGISFPSAAGWIRIELDGTWKLKPGKTLVITPYVWLNGRGGAKTAVPWSYKPQAQIIPSSRNVPTVRMTGTVPKKLSNILIVGSIGPAILMEKGNFFTLDNVSTRAADVSTAYALRLSAAAWVEIKHSSFESPRGAGGGILISQSRTEHSRIIGKGIRVAPASSVPDQNMRFENVVHHSATTPSFTLDSTGGVISHITIDSFRLIPEAAGPFIEVRGPQNAEPEGSLQDRRVRNVSIESTPFYSPLVAGGSVKGLNLYGVTGHENLGTQRLEEATIIRGGEFIGRFVNEASQIQ